MGTWVVVIEATAGPGMPPYTFATVHELVVRLGEWHATGLFCADRYAVQLDITASGCDQALRFAMATHRMAAENLAMATPLFLRAEVVTLELLQLGWQEGPGPPPVAVGDPVPARVYEATRAVLRAASVAEVRRALAQFVADFGGSVHEGPRGTTPGTVTADLGLGPDEEVYASAEVVSIGGLLIEHSLPTLVDDARRACQRLRRLPEPR